MRSKKTLVLLVIGYCIGLFVGPARGEIVDISYSDGQVHIIDSPMIDTRIFCEGDFTTVDVVEGGSLFELYTLDNARGLLSGGMVHNLIAFDSYVSISEGSILYSLKAYGSSQVVMSGLVLGDEEIGGEIYAYDNSQIIVSGGSIMSFLEITGHSQGSISDGIIMGIAAATESGHLTVSGGAIRDLVAFEDGQVTVYGMLSPMPSNNLIADNNGNITIHGSEFYVDFQQVSYGEITSLLNGNWQDEPERNLGIRYDNGEFFDASFYIGHNASIVLTPEPTTLLLLGLGAVMVRRKR